MALYYFSGKETYAKKQELAKRKAQTDCPEFNWGEFYSFIPEIADFLRTPSFVGGTKHCVLWFFPESEVLLDCFSQLQETEVYIVSAELPDRRKKIVSEVLALATERKFDKINEVVLMKCIVSRLKRFGYPDGEIQAASIYLQQAFRPYHAVPDMDLTEVQMHVDMIGYAGELSKDAIFFFAPAPEHLKGYKLSYMLLNQEAGCLAYAQQLLLQGESAIGILHLVLYQIRVCYKASLFRNMQYLSLIGIREYQIFKEFSRYDAAVYRKVYETLVCGINRIKKGENQRSVLLESITRSLAILRKE